MKEIDRIQELAGIEKKEEVAEKVELTAADEVGKRTPSARDVPQAMKMAKLRQKVEGEQEDGGVDFKGLFTGIAKGSISIDDSGKITEANFGIIKDLDEACGKKHKKKMEEESTDDNTEEVEESIEVVQEVAPPGEKAESFITKNKEEFKKRYGDRWEEVLYATAWDKFGESVEEGSEEKKAGRRAAGSYGRPGSKYQKRAASKSSRRVGKEKIKSDKMDLDERYGGDTFNTQYTITHNGEEIDVDIEYSYSPGTNFPIHSASLEPNDPPEIEINSIKDTHTGEELIDVMSIQELDNIRTWIEEYDIQDQHDNQQGARDDYYDSMADDIRMRNFDESTMFPKESLSRYMVEIIVDGVKEGKDAKAISEETAFDLKDVTKIVEWFKNRKVIA